ncbi:TPM domain-containing protein [Klugiella xanthotipulae]|uniref:Putative membrane protein YgcG n=1 Tax=Klugiella xanthotipulae TaxID=244735 RepID=A0A543I722_9MICO|nr:TPM domain-containing protein [Klugiella xanthotipulae]TQM66377.1 putative membrane protein YgcG [Klugiella xanthotipulae]
MRIRWSTLVGASLLTAALTLSGVGPALAANPLDLGSEHVTDTVNALGDQTSAVNQTLTDLADTRNIDLFVVFVDRFSGPSAAEEWANETAERNGLGPRDYLLAIATEGRTYYLSADSAGPVSYDQIGTIESTVIEPQLTAGNWAGAATAAASALGDAVSGTGSTSGTDARTTDSNDTGTTATDPAAGAVSSAVVGGLSFFLLLIVVGGIIALVVIRRTRARARGDIESRIESLQQQGGAALVQTDDAIKRSEQELDFALASYGAEATAPFTRALNDARAALMTAFGLRQKLDDHIPDTDQEREAWNRQILDLCTQANAALNAQVESFNRMRQLEQNAPQAIAAAEASAQATRTRLGAARSTIDILKTQLTEDAVAPIADNAVQAEERLNLADGLIANGREQIANGTNAQAVVAVRTAEDAIAQANLLVEAVDRFSRDLQQASGSIESMLARLQADVASARQMPAANDSATSGTVWGAIESAERTLTGVRTRMSNPPVNPFQVVHELTAAQQNINMTLHNAINTQAAVQRQRDMLDREMMNAGAQISAASDYIAARRGAVGAKARTLLTEASRELEKADEMAQYNMAQALTSAQRASQLGDKAARTARQDVNQYEPPVVDMRMSNNRYTSSTDIAGAFLGGLVGGLVGDLLGSDDDNDRGDNRHRQSSGWGGYTPGPSRPSASRPSSGGGGRSRSGGGGSRSRPGGGGGRSRPGGGRF